MLREIFQWIVYSSKNPELISLTLKGLVPFLLLLGIDATAPELETALSQAIIGIGLALSGVTAIWGFARKLWLTLR